MCVCQVLMLPPHRPHDHRELVWSFNPEGGHALLLPVCCSSLPSAHILGVETLNRVGFSLSPRVLLRVPVVKTLYLCLQSGSQHIYQPIGKPGLLTSTWVRCDHGISALKIPTTREAPALMLTLLLLRFRARCSS